MLQAFQHKALEPTPVARTSYESLGAGGHRSAWGTWFEVSSPWAVMNSTYEVSLVPVQKCFTWSGVEFLHCAVCMCHGSCRLLHNAC